MGLQKALIVSVFVDTNMLAPLYFAHPVPTDDMIGISFLPSNSSQVLSSFTRQLSPLSINIREAKPT